ncbi:enoyl-CoA hydratase-related protein [bacterium]|nr:enoyl-CoA hydratase-related protein [bacterium]
MKHYSSTAIVVSGADLLAASFWKLEISASRLARISILSFGAVLELNDPLHFNGESRELLIELINGARVHQDLAMIGQLYCTILQGAGAHFCTGGRLEKTADEQAMATHLLSIATLHALNLNNELAKSIRKLPVQTSAAVHGKLIGGGVALALCTQFRVGHTGATFNIGNLPRGMNPLFMLS